MTAPDIRHIVPGTMDHHMTASLSLRGFLPRLRSGMRLKPWQVIRCALHRADAACIYLVARFCKPVSASSSAP